VAEGLGKSLGRLALCAAACVVLLCSCNRPRQGQRDAGDKTAEAAEQTKALGINAGCYVCHMTFVGEQLSKIHLQAEVGCVGCHGLSAGHANDENIGATKPDVTFERGEVEGMCLNCHKRHDLEDPHSKLICTDCHGKHTIRQAGATEGAGL